jgi:hypothetical protein
METIIYRLPSFWASALFNGDYSGLEDIDAEILDTFLKAEELGSPLGIDGDNEEDGPETIFCTYHDARPYGILACDCYDYIFPLN